MTNFKTLKNLIDEKAAGKRQAWYNFCEYQGSSVSTRRILESSYRKAYDEYSTVVAACINALEMFENKNVDFVLSKNKQDNKALYYQVVDLIRGFATDKEVNHFIRLISLLKSDILDEHEEIAEREKKAMFDKLVNDVANIKNGVQVCDEEISEQKRLIYISPDNGNKSDLCKEYERLVDARDMHKDELRSIYEAIEDVRQLLILGQYPNKEAMKIAVMIRRRQFLRLNVPLYSKVFLNCALFTVDDLDEIKNIINGSPKEKGTTMFKRRKKK